MVANYDEVMKLALERGFYFPSCEIYSDAPAGFWEYGPTGVNMKNKFVELWRRELVRRDGMMEIDGCQIMSKSVFVASGHIGNFTDPILRCTKCNSTFRADRYVTEKTGENVPERMADEEINALVKKHDLRCPNCKGEFGGVSVSAAGNLPDHICRLCPSLQDDARPAAARSRAGWQELP